MATVYLLNTTVVPTVGLWQVSSICLEAVGDILRSLSSPHAQDQWVSAIGHQSTAEVLSALLGREVPVNRISVAPVVGDCLLCFKLRRRAPEGVILTAEQIESIGYDFYLMELLAPSAAHYEAQCRRDDAAAAERWRHQRPDTRDFLGGHRD
jgi:hypothetical protein